MKLNEAAQKIAQKAARLLLYDDAAWGAISKAAEDEEATGCEELVKNAVEHAVEDTLVGEFELNVAGQLEPLER